MVPMNVENTRLSGVLLIHPEVHRDDRGYFAEVFRSQEFADHGIGPEFVQENVSGSKGGVLRGLHYQICRPQGKLIRVTSGSLYDVAVDLRRSSKTFGEWQGFELSADKPTLLWIPVGFAHGYFVLSSWAELQYKVTDTYDPACERTLQWDDPSVGVAWPIPPGTKPIMSERDTQGLGLGDLDLFE